MELVIVDKSNYKEAIRIQNSIFPHENGALNILASLDRELFIKNTGIAYVDDHIKYYLAKVNDAYVGITGLYYYNFDLDSAWIGWYGILDNFKSKGIGNILLEKTAKLAAAKNFKYIRLYTDYIGNYKAIKLYEKMGFIGEKYTAETLDYDCRIYSKSLIGSNIPMWNNRNLNLSHQAELDQMSDEQIKKILDKFEHIL